MTDLYLIRHAEAEGNLYRIAQGQDNSNLTDRGWRQVAALERRFADISIDAVYSSDLYRTCATASALFLPKGLPLHKRKDLREICVGVWEQRTWGDIYRSDPQQMDWFSREFTKWQVEGAETAAQVRDRVLGAVREIAADNEGKTVALFCHGYAIRVLLATVQGYSLEEAGKTPHGDNTAVSLLRWEDGKLTVVFRDNADHLQTPAYLAEEKVLKRPHSLDVGMWFRPLSLPEDEEVLTELVSATWTESGDRRPFEKETLLSGTKDRVTLVGYSDEEPVGIVQLGPEPGWISLTCVRVDRRKQGYGAQLIGQAVMHWRPRGVEALYAAVEPDSPALVFFEDYGFRPADTLPDGRLILEKDIRFDSRFL